MDAEHLFQHAKWITAPQKDEALGIKAACFRLCFQAPQGAALTLHLSAYSRYRLWVNGQPAVFGPCKGDRWRQYFETVDVSHLLVAGQNTLAVRVVAFPPYEAQHGGHRAPIWTMARALGPCFIAAGTGSGDENPLCVDTGVAPWEAIEDTSMDWRHFALSHWMGAMEAVDGSKRLHGWETAQDTGAWETAKALWPAFDKGLSMFGIIPVLPLTPRAIPLLFEREGVFAREMPLRAGDRAPFTFGGLRHSAVIPPHASMAIELDAAELTTAFLSLSVSGGKGSRIRIRYAESYSTPGERRKGKRDDWEHYEIAGHEDEYLPGGNEETYTPFWFRTFRFIRIEADTADEALTVGLPGFRETGYPLEVRSGVEASEPWVKALWDISVRTLRRCMHETYEDCPYYEQLQYIQDTRLEMLFTYMASGDTRLARRAIEDFHNSMLPDGMLQARYPSQEPHVIPPFSLHWIFMVWEYYEQTGDVSVPRRYRATVDAVLEWYDRKLGALGMVENLGYWDQIDWVDQWDYIAGRTPAGAVGPAATHNLMLACALVAGAKICTATGREAVAQEYLDRACSILDAVEKHCWNEGEGLYMEGPGYDEYSQHAQVYAVLAGLATGQKAREILVKALNRPGIALCSFTWQFFLFRALEKCDAYDLTGKQWELWKSLLTKNLTTVPEVPDGLTSPRSDCHAWGALPLFEFTTRLIGVQPTAPGWQGITVKLRPLSFKWFRGQVITPHGHVTVYWHNEGCFHIEIAAPEGVPLTVVLPDGSTSVHAQGGTVRL